MNGCLFESVYIHYENRIRRQSVCGELWIPDAGILVSWVPGGANLQVAHIERLPSTGTSNLHSRTKLRDLNIPYAILQALRRHLDQQRAREKANEVLILSAKQSEGKLRKALNALKLPA